MSQDRYLSRKEASKSYRPRSYVMSPGLLRARAPFRLQNAITGLVLAGFATAVWAYSIRAVKQDDFSDVDEEAREMIRSRETGLGTGAGSSLGGMDGAGDVDVVGAATTAAMNTQSRTLTPGPSPRGILAPILDRTFPNLLDPTRKTLIWGAPPADDLGRVSLRGSAKEPR